LPLLFFWVNNIADSFNWTAIMTNKYKKNVIKYKPIALAVSLALMQINSTLADDLSDKVETVKNQLPAVQVIGTMPLEGIGLPLEKIPADVKIVGGEQMQAQGALTFADYINANLPGVSVVETQGNPFQPDIRYRGYSASALLGAPQGLSIFQDGVRINEPFGDVVSWDLVPMIAIRQMQLMPGTNPVYGLNTQGGAIALTTKRGRDSLGGSVQQTVGSWGRRNTQVEFGGILNNGHDFYLAANRLDENGWRDSSPTSISQAFGQFGWQDSKTDLNFTVTLADNQMTGNGLVPNEFLKNLSRRSVYTKPDETTNQMVFLNLTGTRDIGNEELLSGNVYYRHVDRKTYNGDLNGDAGEQGTQSAINNFIAACKAGGASGGVSDEKSSPTSYTQVDELCSAAINTSKTRKNGFGANVQWSSAAKLADRGNVLSTGLGYGRSKTRFLQDTQYGYLASDRGVTSVPYYGDSTDLSGITDTFSIYGSNTHSFSDRMHLTTATRYNYTKVSNVDNLIPAGTTDDNGKDSLTASHNYQRLNPSIGIAYNVSQRLTTFASYSEGTRTPTAMELGCSSATSPCKLPNAMAGDPPLKQVVSKGFDVGARGLLDGDIGWSLAGYYANSENDILFVNSSATGTASTGYFQNVGTTRRLGFDSSIFGKVNKFSWAASLSYVRATFEDSFASYVGNHPSNARVAGSRDAVAPGDRIPGVPELQLKLRGSYDVNNSFRGGTNILAFSDSYLTGNENNQYGPYSTSYLGNGKSGGYVVVHLDTEYKIENTGWKIISKVNNAFNTNYNTGGWVGGNMFNRSTGAYAGDDYRTSFFAPGAPRAFWIGLKYEFDRKKSTAVIDRD